MISKAKFMPVRWMQLVVLMMVALCGYSLPAHAQSGKIAFQSNMRDNNNEIYLMNLDGTGLTRLTYNQANDTRPALSADGSKVAWVRGVGYYNNESAICVENTDGTGFQQVTPATGSNNYPVWSPDGTKLAFYANPDSNSTTNGVYLMNADGSGVTFLVHAPTGRISWLANGKIAFPKTENNKDTIYTINTDGSNATRLGTDYYNPVPSGASWSPDNTKLVANGSGTMFLYNADGTRIRYFDAPYSYNSDAVFSPDGSKVVFSVDGAGNPPAGNLYIINTDGSGVGRLTSNGALNQNPSISGGSVTAVPHPATGFGRIVFTAGSDIYTMDPTGWDVKKLTNSQADPQHPKYYYRPHFSPDGSKIAYDDGKNLWVMNADGSNPVQITGFNTTDNPGYAIQPSWSADGQHLAYQSQTEGFGFDYHERIWVLDLTYANAMVTGSSNAHLEAGSSDPYPATGSYATPAWGRGANSNILAFWRGAAYVESTIASKAVGADLAAEQPLISNGRPNDFRTIYYNNPAWNADGSKIVFDRQTPDPNTSYGYKKEIVSMNADGSGVTTLTTNAFANGGLSVDSNPTCSPDGQSIAFLRSGALWTMNADGSNQTLISIHFNNSSISSIDWGNNFDYSSPDTVGPAAPIITDPAQDANTKLTTIKGTAQDDALGTGVATVWLRLQRLSDNLYWTPNAITKWSATPALLATTLGTSTTATPPVVSWTVSGGTLPTGANLPIGAYKVYAYAVDNSGNKSAETAQTFNVIDHIAPTLTITSPQDNGKYATLATLSGTVQDDAGGSDVKSVTVALTRNAFRNGTFITQNWDGTNWLDNDYQTHLINATVGAANSSGVHTWSLPMPDATNYNVYLTVNADDNADNAATPQTISFSVGDVKSPTISLTKINGADATNYTVAATHLTSLGGTVADETGGTGIDGNSIRVQLYRYNTTVQQYEYWDGTNWVTVTYPATPPTLAATYNSSAGTWALTSGLPSGANLTVGSYSLQVQANDVAGNTGSNNKNITITAPYTISGQVLKGDNTPLQGVTFTLDGVPVTGVTTDANGAYTIPDVADNASSGDSHTVVPSLANYVFTPTSKSVTIQSANATGKDFTAAPRPVPTITSFTPDSGKVFDFVTISGTNLNLVNGVKFNGTTAGYWNYDYGTQKITTQVPSGATSGPISLTDNAGDIATSATNFTVATPDTTAPVITITDPANNSIQSTLDNVKGQATDNVGVRGVAIYFYQIATNKYWNGSTWGTAFYYFPVTPINADGTWTFTGGPNASNLTPGKYYVSAQASDAANNYNYADNQVTISAAPAPNPTAATLSVVPATFSETAGTNAATATLKLDKAAPTGLTFSLSTASTSPSGSLIIPGSVQVAANSDSVTFPVGVRDNAVADGSRDVILTATATSGSLNASQKVTITDNDTAGIVVTPTTGLVTTEAGGTATFSVTLTSQPTANVTLGVSSSKLAEGTVAPAVLTFTPTDWNQPHPVTITGVADSIADGDQTYSINFAPTISTDGNYNGRALTALTVVNKDVDTAKFSLSLSANSIGEGGTVTGTVTRNTPVSGDLNVTLSSNNPAVPVPAGVLIPAGQASATFTIATTDDAIAQGNRTTTVTATAAALNLSDSQPLTVTDNDTATLSLSLTQPTLAENGTTMGTLTRNTPLDSPLDVSLASSDATVASVPGTVQIPAGSATVNFTITGVSDGKMTGSRTANISAVAGALNAAPVAVTATETDKLPVPTISSVSPTSAPMGATVTINGTNLQGATVKFGAVSATVNTATSTATKLVTTVPTGLAIGSTLITVQTTGGKATKAFTVIKPTSFTITGTVKTKTGVVVTGTKVVLLKWTGKVAPTAADIQNAVLDFLAAPTAAKPAPVTVDSKTGAYKFPGLAIGTYIVAPYKAGTSFVSTTNSNYGVKTLTTNSVETINFVAGAGDTKKPTVTVTKPTSNASFTKATLPAATGAASDSSGILGVGVVLAKINSLSLSGLNLSLYNWNTNAFDAAVTVTVSNLNNVFGVVKPANVKAAALSGSTWTTPLPLTLGVGNYRVIPFAVDKAFNIGYPVPALTGPTATMGNFRIVTSTSTRAAVDASQASPLQLSTGTASAAKNGVTLRFLGALDAETASDAAHYTVQVNGHAVTVESAGYDATVHSVTLGLPEGALHVGDQVTVTWDGLQDAQARIVAGQAGPLTAK